MKKKKKRKLMKLINENKGVCIIIAIGICFIALLLLYVAFFTTHGFKANECRKVEILADSGLWTEKVCVSNGYGYLYHKDGGLIKNKWNLRENCLLGVFGDCAYVDSVNFIRQGDGNNET